MIALDTSAVARFFEGVAGTHTLLVRDSFVRGTAVLPPVVLTEILSRPDLPAEARRLAVAIPVLPIRPGYWVRAGLLRAELKGRLLKANLADVLIAQACIDDDLPLVTYDRDFRHFERAGLRLA